jgi:hypothetical protein
LARGGKLTTIAALGINREVCLLDLEVPILAHGRKEDRVLEIEPVLVGRIIPFVDEAIARGADRHDAVRATVRCHVKRTGTTRGRRVRVCRVEVRGRVRHVLEPIADDGRMLGDGRNPAVLPNAIREAAEGVAADIQVVHPPVATAAPESGDARDVTHLVQRVAIERVASDVERIEHGRRPDREGNAPLRERDQERKQSLIDNRFHGTKMDSVPYDIDLLDRPLLRYVALIGQWRYSLVTDTLPATMQIAKRVYSLAQEQNDSALLIKAYMALAANALFSGRFRVSSTKRATGCPDLAFWRRTGSRRRGRRASNRLSVP